MTTILFQMIGIGIIGCVLSIVLKKDRPDMSMAVSAITGIYIFFMSITLIAAQWENLSFLTQGGVVNKSFIDLAIRVTGIALVTQFAYHICMDSGETAIAHKIELGGKVIILSLCIPILKELFQTVIDLSNLS